MDGRNNQLWRISHIFQNTIILEAQVDMGRMPLIKKIPIPYVDAFGNGVPTVFQLAYTKTYRRRTIDEQRLLASVGSN